MAKFLNTSGTTYYLEELIKNAQERLYLISPYLKLNDRVKELLEDKDRMKIDVRIVYDKSELHVNFLTGSIVPISLFKNIMLIKTVSSPTQIGRASCRERV